MEVFLGFPEGEEFDAHGGEYDVCVADAVDADTEEDGSRDEWDEGEIPVGFEVCVPGAPVYEFVEEGADGDHGADDSEEEEGGGLGGAGEADFFFWFGDGFDRGV